MKIKKVLIIFVIIMVLIGLIILIIENSRKVEDCPSETHQSVIPEEDLDTLLVYEEDEQYKYALVDKVEGSEENCYLYLSDKDEYIKLKNYTDDSDGCSALVRRDDLVIYKAGRKESNVTGEKEEMYDTKVEESKNVYYYNIQTKKITPLFLSSQYDDEDPKTVVLSKDNDKVLVVTRGFAYLYTLFPTAIKLDKKIKFVKPFLKDKLISKDYKTNKRPISFLEYLFEIGDLDVTENDISYTDPRVFNFDKEYSYKIIVDIRNRTYEEILESDG